MSVRVRCGQVKSGTSVLTRREDGKKNKKLVSQFKSQPRSTLRLCLLLSRSTHTHSLSISHPFHDITVNYSASSKKKKPPVENTKRIETDYYHHVQQSHQFPCMQRRVKREREERTASKTSDAPTLCAETPLLGSLIFCVSRATPNDALTPARRAAV